MKRTYFVSGVVATLHILGFRAHGIPPVPEPGAVLFGRVTNLANNLNAPVSSMTWTVTEDAPNGRSATVSIGNGIEISSMGGETWFVARIPFATASVPGLTLDPLQNGTLALSTTPMNYSRFNVTANGYVASLRPPASSTFTLPDGAVSPPTRSRVEQVDLTITTTYRYLYDEWAAQRFGNAADPRALPLADPDNDGVKNLVERARGTNPLQNDTVTEFQRKINVGGFDYFSYTYFKSVAATDVSVTPQIADTLGSPWNSGLAFLVETENLDAGNGLRRITVRDTQPISATRKRAFIRLFFSTLFP